MKPQGRAGQSAWRIFRWPLLLAVASVVGLVSALVGDGIYDFFSWLCLGGLIVTAAASWHRGSQ